MYVLTVRMTANGYSDERTSTTGRVDRLADTSYADLKTLFVP